MEHDIIKRLSQYKKILQKLQSLGLVRVFSDNLSDALGISSSLVRKDFATCNITGKRRGGYVVEELIERLNTLLGKDQEQKIIIVGCGKLGLALINHKGFANDQIRVAAGFDVDPARINSDAPVPILPVDQLAAFIKNHGIQVAVLTVPEDATLTMLETLRQCGIHGILNFAAVPVKSAPDCHVQNVSLALEVEKLFYLIVSTAENANSKGIAS